MVANLHMALCCRIKSRKALAKVKDFIVYTCSSSVSVHSASVTVLGQLIEEGDDEEETISTKQHFYCF